MKKIKQLAKIFSKYNPKNYWTDISIDGNCIYFFAQGYGLFSGSLFFVDLVSINV